MKNFLTLSFLFFVIGLFAQAPVNDDCDGIIDLGVVPFCPVDTFFTNLNATATDIGNNNIPFGCNPGGTGHLQIEMFGLLLSPVILSKIIR